MKSLLFVTVVMMGVCKTSNGMLPEFKYDFTGASDLNAIISEVNISKTHILPDRVFQLKNSVIEKQRIFAAMRQNLLVARCKFIQSMLMALSGEIEPSSFVISKASMFLLEAAEEGDTDAQEVVLLSAGKRSMTEVTSLDRNVVLDSIKERIKERITSPIVIKDNFLRQYMMRGVIDRLAAIAACDDSCDLSAIIPSPAIESLDDGVLTKRRNRFQMLVGGILPLLTEDDQLEISDYIGRLDRDFQQSQIEKFGISTYEDIEFSPSPTVIPEKILYTTGGLSEILATTPDIAFSNLKDFRKQDFKTVVDFIKAIRLVARVNISEIEKVVSSLFVFSDKWNDSAIETYLQVAGSDLKMKAKEYVKGIRQIIEDLK